MTELDADQVHDAFAPCRDVDVLTRTHSVKGVL